MAREVTLVDAGLGNVASVERALVQVGGAVHVTSDPDEVARARTVVLPGQSVFGAATKSLVDGAMGAALRMVIERGDPFLGICLGMQLLFDGSDENGGQEGLHVLKGRCLRFPTDMSVPAEPGARELAPEVAAFAKTALVAADAQSANEAPSPVATPSLEASAPVRVETAGFPSGPPSEAETPSGRSAGIPRRSDITTQAWYPTPPSPPAAGVSSVPPSVAEPSEVSAPEPVAQPAEVEVPETVEPAPALTRRIKVPHMGWNDVEPTGDHYYFLHSYYVDVERSEDVMWASTYGGIRFAAAVRRDNVLGCQFNPEKSQRAGLKFLRAFLLGGWG